MPKLGLRSRGTAIVAMLLCLSLASVAPSRAQTSGTGSPTVPVLFIPGYAASSPSAAAILSFLFQRGAPPSSLQLSSCYSPLVRSLENAGYQEGKTFFGAVYDWRMSAAPDDGIFDGTLQSVTATSITRGTYEYALDYLGYWLDQAVQANPGLQYVDVVTHSTGGILARAYLQSPAYGGAYIDANGVSRHLPKIRYLILGACPNEGTVHSYRPWNGDFQDVLSGFIPTTEIEGRFTALVFAFVSAGIEEVSGPDTDITQSMILGADANGAIEPDPVRFFRLYDPMRHSLMPTSDFLIPAGGTVATNVNDDPTLRSDVLLDMNALSTTGDNPWAGQVGISGGAGGVIATFASGAREKESFRDFLVPGSVDANPFISTPTGITQLPSGQGEFLPLLDLLQPNPAVVPVTQALFPQTGDTEPTAPLSGDGNATFTSYLSTFSNDPKITLVQWGNGPVPSGLPAGVAWNHETDYPVYHDVFFYNPDVRRFVVSTLTGKTPAPETAITGAELEGLLEFLNGG